MKERPIPFSAEMIRARRAGRKTQTRRVVNYRTGWINGLEGYSYAGSCPTHPHQHLMQCGATVERMTCPYGQPGDRLVVKEAAWMWCAKLVSRTEVTKTGKPKVSWLECRNVPPIYCADHPQKPTQVPAGKPVKVGDLEYCWHKKNARFLPRWASRGLDEVVSIRVERLQDISEADAIAEGIQRWEQDPPGCLKSAMEWSSRVPRYGLVHESVFTYHETRASGAYRKLWESINGPGSWELNPWVWVIEFKVLEGGSNA